MEHALRALYNFGYIDLDYDTTFLSFTIMMAYVGCCINPIIYCIQYRQFQQALRAVLWRRRGPARAVYPGSGNVPSLARLRLRA